MESSRLRLPVEGIFNPAWWNRQCGISFDKSFYFDKDQRIHNDLAMRRALHERFGTGEPDPAPGPIIGSQHVPGGFVAQPCWTLKSAFSRIRPPGLYRAT